MVSVRFSMDFYHFRDCSMDFLRIFYGFFYESVRRRSHLLCLFQPHVAVRCDTVGRQGIDGAGQDQLHLWVYRKTISCGLFSTFYR